MNAQVDAWGHYKCVSLDPPWAERGGGQCKRGADRHYPLMSVEEIIHTVLGADPTLRIAASAHCWVWVTDNYLEGGLALMKAMGFRYVRTLVWVKVSCTPGQRMTLRPGASELEPTRDAAEDVSQRLQIGLGQYLRGSHELALFGVRGDSMVPPPADRKPSVVVTPEERGDIEQVVFAPRTKHSRKPDEAIKVFERVSPGPRLEMFARTARPGWDAWGNEAPGTEAP